MAFLTKRRGVNILEDAHITIKIKVNLNKYDIQDTCTYLSEILMEMEAQDEIEDWEVIS